MFFQFEGGPWHRGSWSPLLTEGLVIGSYEVYLKATVDAKEIWVKAQVSRFLGGVKAMVLDNKHFDDMDDFCDFDDKLEPSGDMDMGESGPNPLSWRRMIIERAASNVKKAIENKADLKASYKVGSLVFDEEANKFGRVVESKPGFLNLSLLAGGKLIRQDINHLDFVRANRQKLTLPEMAQKLFLSEIEVIALLNHLEFSPEKNKKAESPKQAKKKALVKIEKKSAKKKPELKVALSDDMIKKSIKPTVKIAAKKGGLPKKRITVSKDTSISFTKLLPKGATTDPVMDPNGYIQQNFLMMSNRELAVATGLSEHTIRRKLGEWNLKRKDFVNKA